MTPSRLAVSGLLGLTILACGRHPISFYEYPGTIEVNESDAAPLVGGRVVEVRVDEGDSVRIGDTLAILTQSALPATLEDRRAQLAAAQARLADLRRGSRAAEIARAEADLAAAEAEATRAGQDLTRAEDLAHKQIIPAQQLDLARSASLAANQRRDALAASLDLVREGSRADQIRAAEADVMAAQALVRGAKGDVGELAVVAAVNGVVLGRYADPGEVVATGTPLVTVGEVAHRWVRVYLPAQVLSRLPVGNPATVLLGAEGEPPIEATGRLSAVNGKAEFTPRAALTDEERADLLFASKVDLTDPPATMRPGVPVKVRFALRPGE